MASISGPTQPIPNRKDHTMRAKRQMQNLRFVVEQLRQQYEASFDMLKAAVEQCPDALWRDPDSKPAYWHEAYHALFWCDNFVGKKDKPFERCPVHVDIDPRLFGDPGRLMCKHELLDLLCAARVHVAQRLDEMVDADLTEEDGYGEGTDVRKFDVVLHRILYGLRHGQHHVGKLAGRLWAKNVSSGEWRG